jgi:adenine phosphoribosyltransferase
VTTILEQEIRRNVRTIRDYPRKGVSFKDLTTLWKNGPLTREVTRAFVSRWKRRKVDKIVGIEARGFIVGAPVAERLGVGFVPARKVGKLPAKKMGMNYELEYGRQGLEIHSDAISKGDRVLIIDDLLATGGTAKAAGALVEKLGGKVLGFAFVTELNYLKGREKLAGYEIQSLARYDSD